MHGRTFTAAVAGAALSLSVIALTAMPAHAVTSNPQPDDTAGTPTLDMLIGVGSDTSQGTLKAVGDAFNATNPTARIFTYAACPPAPDVCGTITLPSGDITRPNGSTAGKSTLHGAGNNTDIDFARSSSALNSTEIAAGLQAFPFALDTLVIVTDTTTNAPATDVTGADLVKIYDGTYDTWNDLPGNAGGSSQAIAPKIPQSGSGTRAFFEGQLRALNGGTPVTLAGSVQSVQEHSAVGISGDPNAIAPFSAGRNSLLVTPLAVKPGFSAKRALYNVVRNTDVSNAGIQAAFGENGYFCSTEARPFIEQTGFEQLARPANGGVCGAATQAASTNFTLNEQVVTTTTLTVSSVAANQARLVAAVTGSAAPTGTVSFFQGETLLASNVPLAQGQAVRSVPSTPGVQTFRAEFTPTPDSQFEASEDEGIGVVKTSSSVSETFGKAVKWGKKAKGTVTVALSGVAAKATGTVLVKEGSKTVGSGTLTGGKVLVTLKKFKSAGKKKLTAVWAGDANAVGSTLSFTMKQKPKPKKKK